MLKYKLSDCLRAFSGTQEPYGELENRILKYADNAEKLELENLKLRNKLRRIRNGEKLKGIASCKHNTLKKEA